MELFFKCYLAGMVASLVVEYFNFRRHKRLKSIEYIEWLSSYNNIKNAIETLTSRLGIVLGSFIVSLLIVSMLLLYFLAYPFRLVKRGF